MAKKELRNTKIYKEIAELMLKYCVFNGLQIQDYLSKLIENDLSEFKKQIEIIRKVK